MRKEEELKKAKETEEKLYEHEDKLYQGWLNLRPTGPWYQIILDLDEKEEKVLELEDKKEEKLAEAKMHLESKGTPPPESQFKKLKPGENKYSILDHDEL